MKLRFLLNRRQAESLPLLPLSDEAAGRRPGQWTRQARAQREERLERLLTPTERDFVEHHQL
ncbi:hypothetical protein [Nocardia sp. alder85J]|uniref:hypothetical protein n=1 Tax=Nocardia sp. alder85J TaxID=2862949 RepID=UPI001CD6B465|nr:hypothetical protein [Nocardia sp. alder85J]MCX4099000.1 hypothetical protein [Nocardia sp. alder85J]